MGAVDCRNKAPVLERSPYPNAETRPHRNAKVHRAQPALRTCLMVLLGACSIFPGELLLTALTPRNSKRVAMLRGNMPAG